MFVYTSCWCIYIRYIKVLGVDLFARGPQIVLNKLDDQCKPSVQQIFEKQINKILNILQWLCTWHLEIIIQIKLLLLCCSRYQWLETNRALAFVVGSVDMLRCFRQSDVFSTFQLIFIFFLRRYTFKHCLRLLARFGASKLV